MARTHTCLCLAPLKVHSVCQGFVRGFGGRISLLGGRDYFSNKVNTKNVYNIYLRISLAKNPQIAAWLWCKRSRACLHLWCPKPLNMSPRPFTIEARGLQNRAQGPPKSSPEPSKTPFFKDTYLKKAFGGCILRSGSHFGRTCLIWEFQKAPKSRPKAQKINVGKQHVFDIDFS